MEGIAMLLSESFTIFHSVTLVVAISTVIFLWRFYAFRKKALVSLFQLPVIAVAGSKLSGKTSLIKAISGNDLSQHPFVDGLLVSCLRDGNKTLEFVELPHSLNGLYMAKLRKMNVEVLVYVFDVSKESSPIESQMEEFENIRKVFDEVPCVIVANKVDIGEKEKIEKLRMKFGKVYNISAINKFIKPSDLEKEVRDLNYLVQELWREASQKTQPA